MPLSWDAKRHERFGIALRSLVLLGLLAITTVAACWSVQANRRRRATFASQSAPALAVEKPTSAVSADPRAEVRYSQRIDALRKQAIKEGRVSYLQVICAAYEPGCIDARMLARKAAYRRQMRSKFDFVTDYSAMRDPLAAVEDGSILSPGVKNEVRKIPERGPDVIALARHSSSTDLLREAARCLQRTSPQHETVRDYASEVLRFDFEQYGFEYCFQDLNRFNAAMVAKAPIMTPSDAVRALFGLGLPMEYEEVRDAFDSMGLNLSEKEFTNLRVPSKTTSIQMRQCFPFARQLVAIRAYVMNTKPARWSSILRKIIFEAPGHV